MIIPGRRAHHPGGPKIFTRRDMATRHILQDLLAPLLFPLSFIYGELTVMRRAAKESNPVSGPAFFGDPPVPCVSVGNISWGGTGKTPVTAWLLEWAAARGLHAAVLTRGYRACPPQFPFRVRPDAGVREAGDEPLMLARRYASSTVMVDPRRSRAAARLMLDAEESGCRPPDMFILDDGFQHISMGRHLDLVLMDADDFEPGSRSNWNRVIPAGTWREPQSALTHADAFLIKTTREKWPGLAAAMTSRLAPFARPVFAFALQCRGLVYCPPSDELVSENAPPMVSIPAPSPDIPLPEDLAGPYLLVSGVGNPGLVKETATAFMGAEPARVACFPDHHAYTRADAIVLADYDMPVLCTAKDAVKLSGLGLPRLYALDVEADFFASLSDSTSTAPGIPFSAWWGRWWREWQRRSGAACTENTP